MAELLPLPCAMELIKGRKAGRRETRNELKFRVPATEEIWEVACSEDGECEEREIQTAVPKRPDFPIAS